MASLYSSGSKGGKKKGGSGLYSGTGGASSFDLSAPKGNGSPSNFSRVMSVLSRGQYISAGLADAVTKTVQGKSLANKRGETKTFGDAWDNFYAAASGKDQISYSDVLGNAGVKNKWVKGGVGLVGDVLLDPTTYIGAGLAKAPLKAAKIPGLLGKADKVGDAARVAGKAGDIVADTDKALDLVNAASKADRAGTVTRELVQAGKVLKETKPAVKAFPEKSMVDDLLRLSDEGGVTTKASKAADAARGPAHAPFVGKASEASRLDDLVRDFQKMDGGAGGTIDDWLPQVADAQKALPPVGALPAGSSKVAGVAGKVDDVLPASLLDDAAGAATTAAAKVPSAGTKTGGRVADLLAKGDRFRGYTPASTGAVELRMLGKPILRSEKAYELGAKALGPIGQTAPAQLLSQTFRTAHGLLPEVHSLQRKHAGLGAQNVHAEIIKTQKVFQGSKGVDGIGAYPPVTKAGQNDIYKAIQEGRTDLLPAELKIPAEHVQKGLDAIEEVAPGMGRFKDYAKFKGGPAYDRAPQAYIAQYDAAIRKKAFMKFESDVATRFPNNPEVANNLKRTREIFGVDGEVSSQWTYYINEITNKWKKGVTIYRPGFHVRNMLGDSFNAFLAGTDIRRFKDSARVLKNGQGASDGGGGLIKIAGKSYTPTEVNRFYKMGGLETSFSSAEFSTKIQGRLSTTLTNASDAREKYTRMATFIDSLDKGLRKGKSLDDAIEEAAFRVRKYHFDYSDLTPAERKLKQFIPFYTYTRKELPVLLEHTLTSPGKMTVPQKTGSALETLLGVEHDPNDPFPGIDGVIPDYLKGQVIQRGKNKVLQPGLPTDLLSMLGPRSFVKSQAESISPLLKGPIELSTKKAFPSGFDLKKKDQSQGDMYVRYLLSQLPYGNLARNSKSPISERLLNMLTGAGSATVR